MDALTLAAGLAAITGFGAAWHARRQTRRARATVAALCHELRVERHAASHDALTGLPNRRAFHQLGEAMLAEPGRPSLIAVVLDLDNFKQINDQFGHAAGDEVLVAVAQRLSGFTQGRLVARLGGDEFAGLITGPVDDAEWLRSATDRLTEIIAAPVRLCGQWITVTASVGLAPVTDVDLTEALRRADVAMYHAKAYERNGGAARLRVTPDRTEAHHCTATTPLLVNRRSAHPSVEVHLESDGRPGPQRRRIPGDRHPSASSTVTRPLVDTNRRTEPGGP